MKQALLALLVLASVPAFAQEQPGEDVKKLIDSANEKLKARDTGGALDDIKKALEINPRLPDLWIWSARVRSMLNDHAGAIKDFDQAAELAEDNVKIYFWRGIEKQQLRDYQGAEKDFTLGLGKADLPALYSRRALVREFMGDLEGAIKDLSAVVQKQDDAGAYVSRAECRTALGDTKGALTDYKNALFLVTGNAQATILMSRARTKLLAGDAEGAKADFKTAAEMLPDNHRVLFSRGLLHFDLQMYKEALADFRKAIEMDAGAHEYARLYICLTRRQLGEKEAAQKELAEYVAARETKDDWFVKVAGFLSGTLSEADFLKATEDKNENITREQCCEAYWYVGAAALIEGDKKKALEHLSLCVALKVHKFIEYQSTMAVLARDRKAEKPAEPKQEEPKKEGSGEDEE